MCKMVNKRNDPGDNASKLFPSSGLAKICLCNDTSALSFASNSISTFTFTSTYTFTFTFTFNVTFRSYTFTFIYSLIFSQLPLPLPLLVGSPLNSTFTYPFACNLPFKNKLAPWMRRKLPLPKHTTHGEK